LSELLKVTVDSLPKLKEEIEEVKRLIEIVENNAWNDLLLKVEFEKVKSCNQNIRLLQ